MKKYVFGTSPFGPSRRVKAAIRKAAKDINSDIDGARERLIRILCTKFGIGRENLVLAGSRRELLHLIPRVLRPEKALIVGPAENDYRDSAVSAGAVTDWLCGREDRLFLPDVSDLTSSAEGFDMVFLANPNRITGRVLPDEMLSEIINIFQKRDRTLVIDESFMDFLGREGCMQEAAQSRNLIVIRTTSAFFGMPGLELAYAVSSSETVTVLQKEQLGVLNLLSIVAACTALKDKPYGKMISRFLTDEKRFLVRAAGPLRKITLYDSDTHVVLMSVAGNADELVSAARRSGLAVELCEDIMGLDGTFFRVSVMRHEQMVRLLKLLKQFSAQEEGPSP